MSTPPTIAEWNSVHLLATTADVRCQFSELSTPEEWQLHFDFTASDSLSDHQIRIPIQLPLDWQSYVIAPGVLYNGNRFIVSAQPYAPYLLTEGVTPDGPIVISDVPRLTADTGYRTELAANALTTPFVGFHDSQRNQGFLIGLEIDGSWGTTGINLETLPGEPVRVELCLPVQRQRRYEHCRWIEVNHEPGLKMEPGQSLAFSARVISVPGSLPDLLRRLAQETAAIRQSMPRTFPLSFSAAAECVEAKLDAHNWDETNGYYASQIGKGGWPLQTGWVGGGPTFHALAHSANPHRRARARRMLDFICRTAVSPSGYFHGLHDGQQWRSVGLKRPGCRAFSLIRRPLECTRDALKTFALYRSRGESIEPIWEDVVQRNLDAMVNTARTHGHLGYTVDFDTGRVLWGDSTCGAFGITPLVLGAAWFGRPDYLDSATQLAEYYVTHFLEKGFTCGGVGDALMAVDSESSYAMVEGLVGLHDATGDPRHLEWARLAADLFSTWTMAYDAKLPPDSPLGHLGIQSRGAVIANLQNQHAAPGICTASGEALLRLHELTGLARYRETLEDIVGCLPQMVVRPGQETIWGSLPPGSMSERLMTMDGMAPCGHSSPLSCWSEISLLLTYYELPEIWQSLDSVASCTRQFAAKPPAISF